MSERLATLGDGGVRAFIARSPLPFAFAARGTPSRDACMHALTWTPWRGSAVALNVRHPGAQRLRSGLRRRCACV